MERVYADKPETTRITNRSSKWLLWTATATFAIDASDRSAAVRRLRCHFTYANRMPAVVKCLRRPREQVPRAFAVDVLRIEDGMIADITAFGLENQLDAFALPESLL